MGEKLNSIRRIFVFFFSFVLATQLLGCFAVMKEKSLNNSVNADSVDTGFIAPTTITRLSPTSIRDNTVKVRVGGVSVGDTVEVFLNNPTCSGSAFASVTANANPMTVTLSGLTVGAYQVYARRLNGAEVSTCSLVWLDIVVNQTMDPPLISSITATTATAASIQFSNLVAGDTVQLYTDSNCTVTIGSSFTATSATQTITMDSNTTSKYGNLTFYGKVNYSSVTQANLPGACGPTGQSFTFNYPAPTSITRNASLNNHESRFNLTVSGVRASDVVKVYGDSSCTTLIGSATVGSGQTSVDVATSVSLAEGNFELHATSQNSGGDVSLCSTAKLDVTVDLTLNVPTVSSITPTTAISFLGTIGNLEDSTTIEIHRNNTCSQLVSSMAVVDGNTSQSVHNTGLTNGSYEIYARLKYSRTYGDLYSACSSTHQTYNQTGNYLATSFVTKWDTRLNLYDPTTRLTLPFYFNPGTYQFFVHWGDGQVSIINNRTTWTYPGETSSLEHNYSAPGIYEVEVNGSFDSFSTGSTDTQRSLLDILNWGNNSFKYIKFERYKASGFSASDFPDTSQVTSFNKLFWGAPLFNDDISGWDTSSVTDMSEAFTSAPAFNQPLNTWDTSKVINMQNMFWSATAFNQNINTWDVSKVTNMANMFRAASAFNQPLNNWNTASLTYIGSMFYEASSFNQNINTWNVSQITSFGNVFESAISFNQPLDNWNISSANSLLGMFRNATAFNQNINNWNTSNVISLTETFSGATSFNQPLNNWNTSNVQYMDNMFYGATNFNQSLNNWNTSAVESMYQMFYDALSFNQDISMWTVNPKVTTCTRFGQNAPMTLRPNFLNCSPF